MRVAKVQFTHQPSSAAGVKIQKAECSKCDIPTVSHTIEQPVGICKCDYRLFWLRTRARPNGTKVQQFVIWLRASFQLGAINKMLTVPLRAFRKSTHRPGAYHTQAEEYKKRSSAPGHSISVTGAPTNDARN